MRMHAGTAPGTQVLYGTVAYHRHAQEIALALHEGGMLCRWEGGAVLANRRQVAWQVFEALRPLSPGLTRLAEKRRLDPSLASEVKAHWGWESAQQLSQKLFRSRLLADWFWEKSEWALSRRMAAMVQERGYDAVYGFEHGCLEALRAATLCGKKGIVGFVSPHHATRERILSPAYEHWPDLMTPVTERLLELGKKRDTRRDLEAKEADIVVCNSTFTAESLRSAGVDQRKLLVVPLGCPAPNPGAPQTALAQPVGPFRFLYAGPLSVHKGAHVLLSAWKHFAQSSSARLDLFGAVILPASFRKGLPPNVCLHGNVSHAELFAAYEKARILVFPTLCDGFGMVIGEALSCGLPVLTTKNAGGADLIVNGRNGLVIEAGDEDALVEALEWCIAHPQELHAMRQEALDTALANGWDVFRRRHQEGLRAMLGIED